LSPPLGLVVEIGGLDAHEKLLRRVRLGHQRRNDETSIFDGKLNLSVLLKASIESDCSRLL
jgi:hypothetical protein